MSTEITLSGVKYHLVDVIFAIGNPIIAQVLVERPVLEDEDNPWRKRGAPQKVKTYTYKT